MSQIKLNEMTTSELVDRFIRISLVQDEAMRYGDNGTFNRLFKQMEAVKEELTSRPGNQRRTLIPLLEHPTHKSG